MLLIRSPSIIFAFIFSIFSILLTILTFNIGSNHPQHHIQFLIILPPLNCIFVFLLSLTWIERRFRLSYIPFFCLIILLFSCLTITIISILFLSLSIIFYFNLIFYLLFTILVFILILIVIILYINGSLCIHRSIEEPNKSNETFQLDKLLLKSNENQFIIFMSKLPGRRVHNLSDDLNQIHVDTILTLNESKELSLNNNIDIYSNHIKRVNIEHIIYPIRNHFIPKSISDYMQFVYSIILNVNRFNRNRLLVHCIDGMGRTGMTVVCFELVYDYIMNENQQEKKQKFIERFCHYPFLLVKSCRVCQAISNVRKARPNCLRNPLQILFVHEFNARLKSPSYMEQIKHIIHLNEKLLLNNFEELRLPMNI
jgi:protein-tyrosine phosphatase